MALALWGLGSLRDLCILKSSHTRATSWGNQGTADLMAAVLGWGIYFRPPCGMEDHVWDGCLVLDPGSVRVIGVWVSDRFTSSASVPK